MRSPDTLMQSRRDTIRTSLYTVAPMASSGAKLPLALRLFPSQDGGGTTRIGPATTTYSGAPDRGSDCPIGVRTLCPMSEDGASNRAFDSELLLDREMWRLRRRGSRQLVAPDIL